LKYCWYLGGKRQYPSRGLEKTAATYCSVPITPEAEPISKPNMIPAIDAKAPIA